MIFFFIHTHTGGIGEAVAGVIADQPNLIMKRLFLKLGLIPLFCILMYTFILPSLDETQNSFQTRSFIIFNLMAAITMMTPIITSYYCKSLIW